MASDGRGPWLGNRDVASEPRLQHLRLRFRETAFLRPKIKVPIGAPNCSCTVSESDREHKRTPIRGFLRAFGNLRISRTAWWAREDSTLQPNGYESPRASVEFRSRTRRVRDQTDRRACDLLRRRAEDAWPG